MSKNKTRENNFINWQIGTRIKTLRKSKKLHRTVLAKALSLSLQQIQKYELGMVRISAARLLEIAKVLDTPINCFYKGLITLEELQNVDTPCNDGGANIDIQYCQKYLAIQDKDLKIDVQRAITTAYAQNN